MTINEYLDKYRLELEEAYDRWPLNSQYCFDSFVHMCWMDRDGE